MSATAAAVDVEERWPGEAKWDYGPMQKRREEERRQEEDSSALDATEGRLSPAPDTPSRSVRERLREDAERYYDLMIEGLVGALSAETVRYGTCQNCKHRVPVQFPDIRARTQAIEVLVEQGYGRAPQTVRAEVDVSTAAPWAELTEDAKRALVAQLSAKLELPK